MTNGAVERVADGGLREARSERPRRHRGAKEDVASMAEDLAKVKERTEEIPFINMRLQSLEERL